MCSIWQEHTLKTRYRVVYSTPNALSPHTLSPHAHSPNGLRNILKNQALQRYFFMVLVTVIPKFRVRLCVWLTHLC